jgi:hypothetical protein
MHNKQPSFTKLPHLLTEPPHSCMSEKRAMIEPRLATNMFFVLFPFCEH